MTQSPTIAAPLPPDLVARWRAWRDGAHAGDLGRHRRLARNGQQPLALVIACCDARVPVGPIFGAVEGELFIHRNVAALVPPPPDGPCATAAAIDYAVRGLEVPRIVVLGHVGCGGVALAASAGAPPARDDHTARWTAILAPAADALTGRDRADRVAALERQAVVVSLGHLMLYPFVAEAVTAGGLALHGLLADMTTGALLAFDAGSREFVAL